MQPIDSISQAMAIAVAKPRQPHLTSRSVKLGACLLALLSLDAYAAPTDTSQPESQPIVSAITPAETLTADDAASIDPDPAEAPARDAAASIDPDPAEPAAPDSPNESMATIADVLGADVEPLDQIERQIEAREFEFARQRLQAHVLDLERGSHRYDEALVRPLMLLGDAQMGSGEHLQALQHYQHATHLLRVNNGLKSYEQVALVYREATALRALGDHQEANNREEYAYQIVASRPGQDYQVLVAAAYRLADWYLATNNTFAARELYERVTRVINANDKMATVEAIPALQGIARTYRLERYPNLGASSMETASTSTASPQLQQPMTLNNFPVGEQALQQVVRIHQLAPEPDPVALAESVLDLADWYNLFDKPRRANPLYAHAFELLSGLPQVDTTSYFAEPKLLYLPEPGLPRASRQSPDAESTSGFVEIAFSITETGQVRNIVTVASEPEGLMDLRVRRSLRMARYRPAIVDGVAIAKAAHTYRHEFTYLAEPEPTPALPEPADPVATEVVSQ